MKCVDPRKIEPALLANILEDPGIDLNAIREFVEMAVVRDNG
jgi:hypothetical protein